MLPPQATVGAEQRCEAGTQAQMDIFGEQMRDFWKSGPEESRHINRWLAANCFSDYYTHIGYPRSPNALRCVNEAEG